MSATGKRRRSTVTGDSPSKIRATDPSSASPPPQPSSDSPHNASVTDDQYSDLYTMPVDFKLLAEQDPDFAPFVQGRKLDFGDPSVVQQLTKSLLKRDFGLKLTLPDDRLCPPVPNRHNYILWLKALVDSTSPPDSQDRRVVGLDIGTGASCIYPLLGTAQRDWSFIATELDEKNHDFAARNIESNNLSSRITLLRRRDGDSLVPALDEPITFLMTNPPFYTSQAELEASASAKQDAPSSVCTGAPVEMVTDGGEVAFVSRILSESLLRKADVQWYTAMLGFSSSVTTIVNHIKTEGSTNWVVADLAQGKKTKRWIVAWSFGGMRPAAHVCKQVSNKTLPTPPPTEATIFSGSSADNLVKLAHGLSEALSQLDLLSWDWDSTSCAGTGRAPGNVWNRNWRRKKKALEIEGQEMSHSERDVFGFRVSVLAETDRLTVHCRWVEGHDFVTFESFQGFLKRTVGTLQKPET